LLILTATDDVTADYLCKRVVAHGIPALRIDTDTFSRDGFVEYRSDSIIVRMGDRSFAPEELTNVWCRRPRGILVHGSPDDAGTLHTSREWGAALDSFLCHVATPRWMNHPAANVRASSKLFQLGAARSVGLRVPDTLVTSNSEEALTFFSTCGGRVVAKPLSVGYVERPDGTLEGKIYTTRVLEHYLRDSSLLARCPTLLQQQVTKGVDVRVTAVDQQLVAMYLRPSKGSVAPVDIRRVDASRLVYERAIVPDHVSSRLLQLMSLLDIRFGALDFIETPDGEWFFLEVNPNGQWAWMDLLGASDIAELFVNSFGGENVRRN